MNGDGRERAIKNWRIFQPSTSRIDIRFIFASSLCLSFSPHLSITFFAPSQPLGSRFLSFPPSSSFLSSLACHKYHVFAFLLMTALPKWPWKIVCFTDLEERKAEDRKCFCTLIALSKNFWYTQISTPAFVSSWNVSNKKLYSKFEEMGWIESSHWWLFSLRRRENAVSSRCNYSILPF